MLLGALFKLNVITVRNVEIAPKGLWKIHFSESTIKQLNMRDVPSTR